MAHVLLLGDTFGLSTNTILMLDTHKHLGGVD
jgi:hypothetical protein